MEDEKRHFAVELEMVEVDEDKTGQRMREMGSRADIEETSKKIRSKQKVVEEISEL